MSWCICTSPSVAVARSVLRYRLQHGAARTPRAIRVVRRDACVAMVTVRRIRADEGPLLRDLRLRALADAPEAFGQALQDAQAQPDAEWTQAARQASGGDS